MGEPCQSLTVGHATLCVGAPLLGRSVVTKSLSAGHLNVGHMNCEQQESTDDKKKVPEYLEKREVILGRCRSYHNEQDRHEFLPGLAHQTCLTSPWCESMIMLKNTHMLIVVDKLWWISRNKPAVGKI